jgi:hypothetical protein
VMPALRLPSAFIETEFLRLEYLTTTGPRITGLYAKGVQGNLLAETPDVHWTTPHGEYYLRGGHRLWTAPENPFYICPEGGLSVVENDSVTLKGGVDASGLEKQITIHMDGNCVMLSHRVTWHGNDPIELAPWGITQLRLGGVCILPLTSSAGGLAPNRNLVLWPYSQTHDERLELHNDMILLHGEAAEHPMKIGNLNTHGWVAYALSDALFVKRFDIGNAAFPDMGCNVEAYVWDMFIELEILGSLKILNRNESVTMDETWEVIPGQYSASPETARIISGKLGK